MRQSVPSQGKTEALQKIIPREATLEQVPCIRYPTTFPEKICVDSGSEVNAIRPTFAKASQCRSAEIRRHHAGYLWNGSHSVLGDGQVLRVPFLTIATRSTEFASKKEGNARDHIFHPDIKLLILTSASSYFHVMTTSWSCIAARVLNKSRFQWW